MTGKPDDFQQALAAFEDLEHRLGLPLWTVNGIYIWKLLRFSIFSQYCQRLGLRRAGHPEQDRLRKSKVRMICDFPKPFILRNPFLMGARSPRRIVLPHPRKRRHDGRFVDPLSYGAWRPPYAQTTLVLDRTDVLNPDCLAGVPSYEVVARLGWLRGRGARVLLKPTDRATMSALGWELFREIDASALEAQVKNAIKSFIGHRSVFMALLKKLRPHYLYLVVSYGCAPLIAAAQDLAVEVVEFQHGSLGRGHLGYDFKGWGNVPYFPDRMLGFGTEWFGKAYFPKSCTVDVVGYPPLEHAISEASAQIKRRPNQLLALSQGPYAEQVLANAASFAARRPDWEVVIRPHPSENAEHLREQVKKIAKLNNLRVEEGPSLHEHTAASAVVFGVNSTALIEGLLAGCRLALVFAKNSARRFDGLVEEGIATKVKDGDELAEVVDNLPNGSARGYFAEPVDDIVAHVEGPAC